MMLHSDIFTSIIPNIIDYNDATGYKREFLLDFEREAKRKLVCIEDNHTYFIDLPANCKETCFDKWIKETKSLDFPSTYDFEKIQTRLSNKKMHNRKNADLREFLYFNDFYLVKKFFTFGFRTVPENECHIITTTRKPVDLFIAKQKLLYADGFFDRKKDYAFDKYILDANKSYFLDSGYQYLLVSNSKCILHLISISKEELAMKGMNLPLKTESNDMHIVVMKEHELITPNVQNSSKQHEFVTNDFQTVSKKETITGDFQKVSNYSEPITTTNVLNILNKNEIINSDVQNALKHSEPITSNRLNILRQNENTTSDFQNVLNYSGTMTSNVLTNSQPNASISAVNYITHPYKQYEPLTP